MEYWLQGKSSTPLATLRCIYSVCQRPESWVFAKCFTTVPLCHHYRMQKKLHLKLLWSHVPKNDILVKEG
jgi:hypothetical protein